MRQIWVRALRAHAIYNLRMQFMEGNKWTWTVHKKTKSKNGKTENLNRRWWANEWKSEEVESGKSTSAFTRLFEINLSFIECQAKFVIICLAFDPAMSFIGVI